MYPVEALMEVMGVTGAISSSVHSRGSICYVSFGINVASARMMAAAAREMIRRAVLGRIVSLMCLWALW
jgi:hypothetical protein